MIINSDFLICGKEIQTPDLIFADPPFNIGYSYDGYTDKISRTAYIKWSEDWIGLCWDILKDGGSFWVAINDENAAELKCIATSCGFEMRNWVIWHYTFGVHCTKKFNRSHAHLLYFVKGEGFTFNRPLVPSARQMEYGDKRAASGGKTPDDTWVIRPKDCAEAFAEDGDTWEVSRVAGTFSERVNFSCQMPEKILDRIISSSSNPGDMVLDPFCGSGTTLAVAKKLGRRFVGIDISKSACEISRGRVS